MTTDLILPFPDFQAGNLSGLTITELHSLVLSEDIKIVDYAGSCLDQIERLEGKLHAWAYFDADQFLKMADILDTKLDSIRRKSATSAVNIPRLFGAPIGIKDIFNTHDMPTRHGSGIYENYRPGNDARVVASLRGDDALIAGKTSTAEFAVHTASDTCNPYDMNRSCGTSSGGSAVAVATNMVPAALASQTGGSTIRPASYCGVYGFKPSYGLLPRTAMLKTTDTLDTVGLFARSVNDIAILFESMRVRGLNYPYVEQAFSDPERLHLPRRKLNVALLNGPNASYEAKSVRSGLKSVTDNLTQLNCRVLDYELPKEFEEIYGLHERIYCKSLSYYFKAEFAMQDRSFSSRLREMIEYGDTVNLEQYQKDLKQQGELAALFDQEAQKFDVIICPSTADEAPVGLNTPDLPDHCLIFTACYAPALSIPMLKGSDGLPVGLQISSRRFNDYLVLEFANRLKQG